MRVSAGFVDKRIICHTKNKKQKWMKLKALSTFERFKVLLKEG